MRLFAALAGAGLIIVSVNADAADQAQNDSIPEAVTKLPPPPPDITPVVAADVAADPARCEIHVWSTTKLKSYVSGWGEAMGGGVLAAALDGDRAKPKTVLDMLEEALAGKPQATLLARLDLGKFFDMPGAVIVPEKQTSQEAEWKNAKGRLSGSTSPCYGEIIVRDMYFLKTALFPPTLRVNFTFRDFRDGKTKPVLVQGRGGVKLDFYPSVSTNDLSVITRGFQDAYVADFEEFIREQKTKELK